MISQFCLLVDDAPWCDLWSGVLSIIFIVS